MTLRELEQLLRLSAEPIERPSDVQLDKAEALLGTKLPKEYRDFIKVYGSGQVASFLGIYNPISHAKFGNLLEMALKDTEEYGISRAEFPDDYYFNRYPEAGGLLPWGRTDNGDHLYWLTRGQPCSWPIVVWKRDGDWHLFRIGFTNFIGGLLTGRWLINVFSSSFEHLEAEFKVLDRSSKPRYEITHIADNL